MGLDIHRKKVLACMVTLGALWNLMPQMRFFQFLSYVQSRAATLAGQGDSFYLEDDGVLPLLKRLIEEAGKEHPAGGGD